MLKLCLIRHGKTYGNTKGRYIGVTDESLCEDGRKEISEGRYPQAQKLYVSPMKRCVETAHLIYPEMKPERIEEFRECDFGIFENKNYLELAEEPRYQAWIDSNGSLPFPEGEDARQFRKRCQDGFRQVVESLLWKTDHTEEKTLSNEEQQQGPFDASLIVHGGTIMSILEAFAEPKADFYHWQVKNGQGFLVLLDEQAYRQNRKILLTVIQRLPV